MLAQGIGLFSNDVQVARAGRIQNVKGNELAKTPSFTGNVALNWSNDHNWGELKGTLQYTYRDKCTEAYPSVRPSCDHLTS